MTPEAICERYGLVIDDLRPLSDAERAYFNRRGPCWQERRVAPWATELRGHGLTVAPAIRRTERAAGAAAKELSV